MNRVSANGIEIAYELDGPQDGPVLLLIHGVGAQLIRWPKALCDAFVAAGFRVLRFDNRDIGLSTHMTGAAIPDVAAVKQAVAAGQTPDVPYTLSDLAADTAGLLDALKIDSVHVFGVSLGGMIAQVLAIEHPNRVKSLTIVMSQSGNPDAPPSDPDAMAILARRAPDPRADREAFLSHQVLLNRTLGSPLYPADEGELRRFAALAADRAWNPEGPARQFGAIHAAADRRPALRQLTQPTLVIHGADDPLIKVECGEDIAAHVPGAWLLRINGMGHDLPDELTGLFVSAVAENARRAG